MLCFQVPEPERTTLLPHRPSCSITTGLVIISCLLLILGGGWLVHTIYWLHSPSIQPQHRPPAPGQAPDSRLSVEASTSAASSRNEACSLIPDAWRFDCYPERGVVVTRQLCEARKCCFIPASTSFARRPRKNGIPWCFYPLDFPSYSLASLNDTSMGLKGTLVKEVKTYYPGDILSVGLEIRHETDTRLRVRVSRVFRYINQWTLKLLGLPKYLWPIEACAGGLFEICHSPDQCKLCSQLLLHKLF